MSRPGVIASFILIAVFSLNAGELFPEPEALSSNVKFWINVYSLYSTNEIIIHDSDSLHIIYTVVNLDDFFPADTQERIKEFADDDPYARLIKTHPGMSHYASLMITAEIGDVRRFSSTKRLVSFAGLNPSVYQSGERCYTGHISKQGSKNLRWILIQCANVAVQMDRRLKSYYMRKKLGKGHNKAIVAVARKILINLYVMMTHNIPFHALRVNKVS